MGRLADTLAKASEAIAGLESATERDVTGIIERTQELHKKRQDVMTRRLVQLDSHMADLTEFARDLDDFGKNDHSGAGGSSSGSAYTGTAKTDP